MPEYAVIIPTLNEAGNVRVLAQRLEAALDGLDWEAVFVDDDSKDGTLDELHTLAKADPRIRFIRRVGRRGLASACVEGMLSTTADYLAVMDADLQHDETKLPELFSLLASGRATLAVASRYTGGGGTGSWDATRARMSRFANAIVQKSLLAPCSDPMSGFFALHRSVIDRCAPEIQSRGFKVLYDILTIRGLPLSVREVPYVFRERAFGNTKLSLSVLVDFLRLLLAKYFGRLVHAEFVMFCLVGLVGVGVHLAALYVLHRLLGLSFLAGQSGATLLAMSSNYLLNNVFTFRDRRLHGREHLAGYLKFVAGCALGAFTNVASATYLQGSGMPWALAACAGTAIGAIINYFFARFFIWKREE